jgi:tRNA(Ile2) C34 agmatinyltransferase TiaS
MRYFLGFDDTDTLETPYGTGKVARWFETALPGGCRLWGVVRQQLLVHESVPYTSHNSSACLVVDTENGCSRNLLLEAAVDHLKQHSAEGSDPGLCLAAEGDMGLPLLMDFGQRCTQFVVGQDEAYRLAEAAGIHLSAHGGTGQGVIGAMASIGLTVWGWAGRCIELGKLRSLPRD